MRADDETSMHVEPDAAPDPIDDADARDVDEIGEADELPDEDVEADELLLDEADDVGIPEDAQPESQGEDPLEIDLGEEGQGDLAPEDE